MPSGFGLDRSTILHERVRICGAGSSRSTIGAYGQLIGTPSPPAYAGPLDLPKEHDAEKDLAVCVHVPSTKSLRRIPAPSFGSPSARRSKVLFAARLAWSLSSASLIFASCTRTAMCFATR